MAHSFDVTLVSLYPPPGLRHAGRSGVASYTANLANALRAAGARVEVVAPIEPGLPMDTLDGGIRVRRVFRRGPLALSDAAAAVRRTGASLVHLQFETFLYGGPASVTGVVPSLMRLRRDGIASVVTMHQVIAPEAVDRAFVRRHRVRSPSSVARSAIAGLQQAVRSFADRVIVHEPTLADALPGSVVIRHGVESLDVPDRDVSRGRIGLGNGPVVLCFGYIAPYKGLEAALEASRRAGNAFTLVVAGGPHPRFAHRDRYARDLQDRWADAARFTGFVAEEDVGAYFASADVALYPYTTPFSSSGALALALGYGTPVQLSKALADCIRADDVLVVPGEGAELSTKLTSVLHDPGRLSRIRFATMQLAAGRSWPDVAAQHVALYEEVLGADRLVGGRVRSG